MSHTKEFTKDIVLGAIIGVIFGLFLIVPGVLGGSGAGIIDLTSNGVLLCGESITLNSTDDVSDDELRQMTEMAITQRQLACP